MPGSRGDGGAGPSLVLHGDAHAGNLLHAAAARPGADWIWIDLEETCRGPREFDLAVLAASQAASRPKRWPPTRA